MGAAARLILARREAASRAISVRWTVVARQIRRARLTDRSISSMEIYGGDAHIDGFQVSERLQGKGKVRSFFLDPMNSVVYGVIWGFESEMLFAENDRGERERDLFSPRLAGVTVDKSVEFSYEELAAATENFNLSYKIGQGGFRAVYYAELRGERAAIKKMDMQASKEFLAELKVLKHVHHLNLVYLDRGVIVSLLNL
ncbi:hypothetical protein QQ045_023072 [Rhodiola kirilowii]